MYTDKNYVFEEIRKGVNVGINEWRQPGVGSGLTIEEADRKLKNYIPYFVSKYKPNFCNRLYDSDSEIPDLVPRVNTDTYKQLIMGERFVALKKCKLGGDFLEVKDPGDVLHYDYTSGDGICVRRGYWTQTPEGLWVIQLLSTISSTTRILMAVLEYPKGIDLYPKIFEELFIMKGIYDLKKGSDRDLKAIINLEQELAQLYYSSSEWEYEVPTPYQYYTRSDDSSNVR